MKRVRTLLFLFVLIMPVCIVAQDVTNFTQFFINPYTFNPSYAGIEGRNALFLSYRRQWATIEGGPTVANFSYHTPLKGGVNFGLSISTDKRGVLNTTGSVLTLGYTVTLGQQKYIRFGLSAGGATNGVDLDAIADANDPALSELLESTFSLLGSAGISVHLKSFHFGASLPSIFAPAFISSEAFTITEVKPFQNLMVHASNRFYFNGDRLIFEPYVIYRMNNGPRDGEVLPSQYEIAGVLHLNHTVWVGGSYKQDFGISALGGIKNQFFLLGASYSIKNSGINELNSPTYELHLGYLFGQKKKNKQVYSFLNSEKEKIKKAPVKSPAQLAAEKKKEAELAKQKEEQEQLAREEAERVEREQQAAAIAAEEARIAQQRQAEEVRIAKENEARIAQQRQAEEVRKVQEAEARTAQQRQAQETRVAEEKRQAEVRPAQVVVPVVAPVVVEPRVEKVEPPKQEVVVTQTAAVPQPLVIPYIKSSFGVHDGGPRFTNKTLLPVLLDEDEQVALRQFEEKVENPIAPHGTNPNFNPNAQRHEFIKRGTHPNELDAGNYIINGVFSTKENADRFTRRLNSLGFTAKNGYSTNRRFWYIYLYRTEDINEAKRELEKYRNLTLFKDAWLLTVE